MPSSKGECNFDSTRLNHQQPGRFQVLARFAHIYFRNGQEWYRLRHSISPKILRPKIVEENIENFKAVTKDAIARFVELKEKCGPNDHIPDLEGELGKWSMEGKQLASCYAFKKQTTFSIEIISPCRNYRLSINHVSLPKQQILIQINVSLDL